MQKPRDLAPFIDHSCLRPEATPTDVQKLCEEALEYKFRAVSVNSAFVIQCSRLLKKSPVSILVSVGFPLGACTTDVKIYECKRAVEDGAHEVEVVMSIGQLRGSHYTVVERELDGVVRVANGAPVRVIVEACLLTKEELVLACKLAKNAGASGVQTSTGFSGGTATIEHVRMIRNTVGAVLGVKASGGIRTFNDAESFLQAGASSLGTSSGPRIITCHEHGPGSDKELRN